MYKHTKNLQANANPPINSDDLTISLLQRLKGTHSSKAWSPYIKKHNRIRECWYQTYYIGIIIIDIQIKMYFYVQIH